VDPLSVGEVGIKSRLRKGAAPLKLSEQSGRIACDKFRGSADNKAAAEPGTGNGEIRAGYR
jgi:hypothetical protein